MKKGAKLKNVFKLSSRVTLYVPSTRNVNEEADTSSYVEKAAELFSRLFGGSTVTPALGYWLSPAQGLVKEKTTLVFSYCSDSQLEAGIEEVVGFCEKLKEELDQEAIAVEINGELYLI